MRTPSVIWLTGLSSSGKTTISKRLYNNLAEKHSPIVLLDGDDIRVAFGEDLGHKESDRIIQIKRIQNIANILVKQNVSVIVAALYSSEDLLRWNRLNLQNYFEIYLKASIKTVESRDTKNLYSPALDGKIKNVVGIDIDYSHPKNSDVVVDMDKNPFIPEVLAEIIRRLKK